MKRNAIPSLLAALWLAAVCGWAQAAGAADATDAPCVAGPELDINPASLIIGTFYAGQPMEIQGEIAAAQDILLEVKGPEESLTFDLKGKVGPFWMNRGLVKVAGAPSLYILLLPESAPAGEALTALGVGLAHLQTGLTIDAPSAERAQLSQRFVDFNQASGLFQEKRGAITYAPAGQGRKHFTARFSFPTGLAAGEYKISATVLEGGARQAGLERDYLVEDGGFLKLVKDMAYQRALLFGVLSVLIALASGAIMGVVFKGGKGGH